jgi:uncharacterized protein (TIGR03067 family)
MKRAILVVAAGLLLAADKPGRNAAKEEAKKLQGAWDVVSLDFAGKKVPRGELPITGIVIKGDQLRMKLKGPGRDQWTFKLVPGKNPKWIDLTPKGEKVPPLPCIYDLKGTELRLCMPLTGTKEKPKEVKRPDSFDTKGKPALLLVCEPAKK